MSQILDSPQRFSEIRDIIQSKGALKRFYLDVYKKYRDCLNRCPQAGMAIEIGSGAGFAKSVLPELITTDVVHYPQLDKILDATCMPFPANSLRAIFMLNVFHHIPDVILFFREAERCLVPGGRIFMTDQNKGWISTPILKYFHHEPFVPDATEWKFESAGPLSGANGALAWLVFQRDFEKFAHLFPGLTLEYFRPHSPLLYWIAGGLKKWTLIPEKAFKMFCYLDRLIIKLSPKFGSFVDIELVKR